MPPSVNDDSQYCVNAHLMGAINLVFNQMRPGCIKLLQLHTQTGKTPLLQTCHTCESARSCADSPVLPEPL